MDECVQLNRRLSQLIDKTDLIEQSYIIEVSSPGIGRVMKEERELRCILGRDVVIKRKNDSDIKGNLLDVQSGKIIVTLKEKVLEIDLKDVENVKQDIKSPKG